MHWIRRSPPILCLAVVLVACSGQIGSSGGNAPEEPSPPQTLDCKARNPGPSPLRRLIRREYDATVHDLLGTAQRPAQSFPPDNEAQGFNNNAALLGVPQVLSDGYMDAAESLAQEATANLTKLLPCDPKQAGEDACAKTFIAAFGERAFRRPLDTSEQERFFALYASGKQRKDFVSGIALVVEAALVSPFFLYRVEMSMPSPSDGEVVKLSHYEVASRLSYLLWGTMPDEALFAAADAGKLGTKEGVGAEAQRMLDDPRAKAIVDDFHAQWLEVDTLDTLDKDPTAYPAYNEKVRAAMRKETQRFVEYVVFEGEGNLDALLSANYTFMDKTLADYYGVTGPAGQAFEKVTAGEGKSRGVLTHAGFLAMHANENQSSPVLRGKFVRERLLCEDLPPPPPDIVIQPPAVQDGVSTKEKFKEHDTNPACTPCHKLMDPIGYGFENFDGAGRWRDTQYGKPIDASGEVVEWGARAGDAAAGAFDGVGGLSQKLAASQVVRDCLVTQWFRYGYGRSEAADDQCTLAELKTTFSENNRDVRALLIALTQTDAFLYRRAPSAQGGKP